MITYKKQATLLAKESIDLKQENKLLEKLNYTLELLNDSFIDDQEIDSMEKDLLDL